MESIESIKNRLHNCEENIKKLKEMNAPKHLIESHKQLLQSIKDNLRHRQEE